MSEPVAQAQLVVESRTLMEVIEVETAGHRIWMRADPRARRWDEEVARGVLELDEYFLEPLRAAGHRLRTVVDIGAHIGTFVLQVKRHWPEAQVVAAEPDPASLALLRRNVGALPGVTIYAGAILGRPGIGQVHLRQGSANHDRNAAGSAVTDVVRPLSGHAEAWPTALVPACDVLDLLDRHGNPHIDLLKLDCEGAEGEILERLAAAGRMHRIGWLRGEWHYLANLPRIEAALAPTHTYHLHHGEHSWGGMIAHRNLALRA
jgi:FkbM family methyltransferase